MDRNVYPCIVYQRLRPSAPHASKDACAHVWPLTDQLIEHEGYTRCGAYGDSEYAAPFCGGSEIRPGYALAQDHARRITAKLGGCTLLIGDAAPIGDGDPFLPPYLPPNLDQGVHTRLVNFHLRSHARSTSLHSAWRYFDHHRQTQHEQAAGHGLDLTPACTEIEVIIRRDAGNLLARLYLTNPSPAPVTMQWKQLVHRQDQAAPELSASEWFTLTIPARRAAYLEAVLQGELPWVRQLRVKSDIGGRKAVGSAHITPSDMARESLSLVWEALG